MRILLTGVNGQVGSALHAPLSAAGTVLAADRNVLDLSNPNSLSSVLDELKPQLIVNPAAYTAVDLAEEERDLAYTVNAEAPRVMAQWAAKHDVPIVHFSTDYVFNGSGDQPWREDDPTGPLSVYGASKLAGEIAVRDVGGSHLVIRTSWVFAATGKNFLKTIIRLAHEREELRIVADQIGAPTSARSIADALGKIVDASNGDIASLKRSFARANGLIHLANSGQTSWHGFASGIVDGLRTRGEPLVVRNVVAIGTADFPTKAARPMNSRLDTKRLDQVFGIQMPVWQTALDAELCEFCASK